MSRIILTVDGTTVYDSGAGTNPVPTPLPPATPPSNMIMQNKSDYPGCLLATLTTPVALRSSI